MKLFLLASSLTALNIIPLAHGHGYMFEPISRNYYAQLFGLEWGTQPNVPNKEYCYHCLNTKGPGQVCGTSEGGINYDVWEDSLGQPVSWNSNGNVYGEGDFITIGSFLTAHHTGHMEVRACPMGRASTQECFDSNILEFVEDLSYGMPKDENHPERGYYYGSPEFNNEAFEMRFKLPEGLVGEQVLLQWWYFTANSCLPPGYNEYYARVGGDIDPIGFWNPAVAVCTPDQYTEEFYSGEWPERFVNCAEITIVSQDDAPDNNDNNNNVPIPAPVDPTTQPPVPIVAIPEIVAPVPDPTASPVALPVTELPELPEPDNNDGGGACCSLDYKTCATWCQDSKEQCEISPACLNMKWLDNGALPESATCEPRWGVCTNDSGACCDGLVCKDIAPYFKQCLAPGDPPFDV